MAAIASRLDRFGFDSRAAMGVGGVITTQVFPIVLFTDGVTLTDVEGLAYAGGLDAHRRAHPEDWTHRRRDGLEYQLDKKGKWQKIAVRKTYSTLPAGFRLNGHFSSHSGTGTIATTTVRRSSASSSPIRRIRRVSSGWTEQVMYAASPS